MLKKTIYGVVAALGLALSAQVALADSQYWNGERYESVASLPFPAPASRYVAPVEAKDSDRAGSSESPFPPTAQDD